MPTYEYRCLECDAAFEQRRAMSDATEPRCPAGHADVRRVFSVFAAASSAGGSSAPMSMPAPTGGGCCGGGCGCG